MLSTEQYPCPGRLWVLDIKTRFELTREYSGLSFSSVSFRILMVRAPCDERICSPLFTEQIPGAILRYPRCFRLVFP